MNEKGPSGKRPIFREIDVNRDRDRLLSFDASFTTDRIYHVEVKDMKVKIDVKTLDAPFYKRYPIAPVVFELGSNVFAGTSVLVESGGDIAGFAVMKHESWNRRAHLEHLYIASAYQGRGLGRMLVEKAIGFAKEHRARCLWLETQNVNYPAIQFYKKMGFRLCGFDNTLYEPADRRGEAALFFAMDL